MNMNNLSLAAAVAAALACAAAGGAAAQDAKTGSARIGSIEITQPWARATPKGASVGAGYLTLTNTGATPDRLVGGTSDASSKLEIHEMSMTDGVMRMRPVANGVEIKPGQTVAFKPSSYHLMFVGLKDPLQQGQTIKGTLTFEKAGSGAVAFPVLPVGSPGPAGSARMDHMDMGPMDHMQMK